jgi:deoxyribodipyrimidine photo-lyase
MIHPERIYEHSQNPAKGNVIYWMSRDQRVKDNWGLLHARQIAEENEKELAVVFCLVDKFLEAGLRQYDFMLHGLGDVSHDLQVKNIPFYILTGNPPEILMNFGENHNVSHIICDFDPLRIKKDWQKEIAQSQNFNLIEVDSHNIVPARVASNKVEFGAYTIRPKIKKKLNEYLGDFPVLKPQSKTKEFTIQSYVWSEINKKIKANKEVGILEWLHPGESSASDMLDFFISEKLSSYSTDRNDPNKDALSNLSPYLHFGHIAAQRVALEILKRVDSDENTESYLEELIIRRELSDNYCFYNPDYDSLKNIPDWAKKTLSEHKADEREFIYSMEEFEQAKTHENLWNAAQRELVVSGKLHGYMRMYWAKKILEWSVSPEEALKIAIYLNDKYNLDGRDPNGYVGCAWAIAGVHDRAWQERPVFGKIRYMNYNGAKRKFDTDSYIKRWLKK